MRILNVGCGNRFDVGTDFVDLYPQRNDVKKVDINKEKLPYKNGSFDEVYSRFLLGTITNTENFFSETRRVLKKGGTIKLFVTNATALDELIKSTLTYEHLGINFKVYSAATPEMMRNWLSLYGYKQIRVKTIIPVHTHDTLKFKFYRLVLHIVCAFVPRLMPGIYCEGRK